MGMHREQQKSKNLSTHNSQKEKCLGQGVMREGGGGGGGGHVFDILDQLFTYTMLIIRKKSVLGL
jgi:hypothetical protein